MTRRAAWATFSSICAAGLTAAALTGAAAVIEARSRVYAYELAPWAPATDAELCTWAQAWRLGGEQTPAWAARISAELLSRYTPDAVDYAGCAPW